MSRLVRFVRSLRGDSTDAERALWRQLRNRRLGGFKFRRQAPIGRYIADFACFEAKVVVELDGSQHADEPCAERDHVRDEWLESQGFEVLRFWNMEVIRNTGTVLKRILKACQRTLTCPLASRERRRAEEKGGK